MSQVLAINLTGILLLTTLSFCLDQQRFISTLTGLVLKVAALVLPLILAGIAPASPPIIAGLILILWEFLCTQQKVIDLFELLQDASYLLLSRVAFLCGLLFYSFVVASKDSGFMPQSLTASIWLQALVLVPLLDLKQYWLHRLQHHQLFFWRLHQIHHTSKILNILAGARANFFDLLITQQLTSLIIVYALGISLEVYIAAYILPVSIVTVFWSHSDVTLGLPSSHWIYRVVATPDAHRLHHTREFDRTNYGELFMFWDVLFGTFKAPTNETLAFGTHDSQIEGQSMWKQHLVSLHGAWAAISSNRHRQKHIAQ